MGAHREAAAQYARVLRFGENLSLGRRAELLELRSTECVLTDQTDDAIAAIEEALAYQRELGAKLRQGDLLCQLALVL